MSIELGMALIGFHDRLHENGFISDPRGKGKSVVFTDKGMIEAQRLLEELSR